MKATSLHSPNWSQLRRSSFLIALGQRLALLVFFLCAALLVQPCPATPFQWEDTGSLNIARRYQSGIAIQLLNRKVLVEAGSVEGDAGLIDSPSAELYDPSTGTWTLTGNLNRRRFLHTATLLPDGKVLVAAGADIDGGGYFPIASAELYDPATGTWTLTRPLNNRRFSHTATLLPNGKVLVVGGSNNVGLTSAELYDPASGTWRDTGSLNNGHSNHTATLLPNGMVLVAGGLDSTNHISANADVYDPATRTWTVTGSLNAARFEHTATLLTDGKVLVVAGRTTGSTFGDPSAELYDPATGTWTVTGSLNTGRYLHTATLLPGGLVMVAAGDSPTGPVSSAEIYDPASGRWTATGSLNTARSEHTAALLSNGLVLVAGGANASGWPLASAELYGPGSGAPNLVSAASRLTHRAAGSFDIDMPLGGTSGVEDRDASGSFLAVFTFDAPVTSGNAQVVGGTATAGTPTFSGNEMRVPLSNVADVQVVTIELSGVNEGGATWDVPFGFLIGDVDGNRMVAKADDNIFRIDQHQVVTGSNFRDDINLSGVVDRPDHLEVKAHARHSLP
jgi:Galactose oxidase, central domain